MVSGPAAADAVARARRLPKLRVGLHLVLVDGEPTLPAHRIAHLVDPGGCLRSDMTAFGAQIFLRRRVREQVVAEIDAQFDAFAQTGLTLDHVNGHHHFHVHPTIGSALLSLGREYGLRAVRVPREPTAVLHTVERDGVHRKDWRMAPWLLLMARRARALGLTIPDRVFGLAWSGALHATRLQRLLELLPDGTTEIYLHPASCDKFAGATPGYRYRDELDALMTPAVLEAARKSGARLGGYGDVARA
jgi:hopanoid biosynthesis associated protein HpnK